MNEARPNTDLPENQGVSFVFRATIVCLVVDVLLVVLMARFPDIAEPFLFGFTGWIVAQCGLCCTAFQRSTNLCEGSAMLLVGLLFFSPIAAMVIVSQDDPTFAGLTFLAACIAIMIGLFLHTVPLLIIHRLIFRDGKTQFSIWQIMVLTALIGVGLMLLTVAGAAVGRIAIVLLFLFGPTVFAGLVLNYIDRSIQFLPAIVPLWGIVGMLTLLLWPESIAMAVYLVPQTLGATLGGVILLQVPRSGPHIGDPLPRSFAEPPGPFDAMEEAAAESDFS